MPEIVDAPFGHVTMTLRERIDIGTEASTGTRPTLLIVDDEPPLLRLLEFLFLRQGYNVLTATNGMDALTILQQDRPDLVILDVMMPRMDGYQVAEAVRADAAIAHTPIIMLTAKAQEEDKERGEAVGVDTYMTKPFEPERLSELVATYLNVRPLKTVAK